MRRCQPWQHARVIFNIPYKPLDTPSTAKLPEPGELGVSLGELAWAAVTTGRILPLSAGREAAPAAVLDWRLSVLLQALAPPKSMGSRPRLLMSRDLRELDGSEKAIVSYLLGGVSARIFAEKLFGATYLVHYDAYLRAIKTTPRGERPDFIGISSEKTPLIIEAKGRRSRPSGNLMATARDRRLRLARPTG